MSRLKTESTELEHEIDFLETEVLLLRRELKKKDQDNIKLQREIHKLKVIYLMSLRLRFFRLDSRVVYSALVSLPPSQSVLQEASIFKHEGDLLSSLQDSYGMPGQIEQLVSNQNPNKKQGVSGESSDHGRNHDEIEIQRYEKDFRYEKKGLLVVKKLIKNLFQALH